MLFIYLKCNNKLILIQKILISSEEDDDEVINERPTTSAMANRNDVEDVDVRDDQVTSKVYVFNFIFN